MNRVSEGKIINAASSDLVLLDYGHFVMIHLLFEPFVAIIHLIFLGLVIGYNVIWGFIVMIFLIFFQAILAACLKYCRFKSTVKTD